MSEEAEIVEESTEEQSDRPRQRSPKQVNLPLSRIKQIIKLDPEVNLASMESVFLVTKAAELFIETLTKDAYSFTASAKKKTIQRRDIDSAVANADSLFFLEGTLD
ncbi:hypothetical protein AAG570_000295 [Ranatra chinensis]|uniref:Transcription factor CBF/NF-Y/archaeal histone domain-containing protein n=1 Tax=Ranatra chinensis TaxID=642074 RepID=A0ABD0ZHV4_9HEMI